ncbi:MAG: succinate-semialdehyde dehydrogenase [Gammaproteobacteria bacterium HGW-Gammaproteobacteria-4]|jgi:succinate-semialdehyde dehydrogenase/glutarate-semialdehyde dehydrogenase|nr:MAG: succinate-semialdehyde dehydrogenase [Gammaproteobacteria bacterium HGW-Gammaproteobacteria-4]
MDVEIVNPWTGNCDYRYDYMSDAQVEALLAASARGFADWSRRTLSERAAVLRQVACGLRNERELLAQLMSAEMGKLRREGLAEIEKSAAACDYYAERAGDYLGDEPVATEARRSYVSYEPIGCVLAIMPWNFPVWQVFRFLAPALMAGNVALLKHAITVPRCADAIARIVHGAGVPAGAFGVLHIDNDATARVIADGRIAAVTLTGSERAGRSVAATAGKHLKKCVLELGGSDPFVVLDDADLDRAIAVAVLSRFGNAGQTCIAAKRFIVVKKVLSAFSERLLSAARDMVVGDPMRDVTGLAPMARADLRNAVHAQVERSVAAGAVALVGCRLPDHPCAYPASVLTGVVAGMPAYDEELFGPVASILAANDDADAVRIANDTRFGLGASVWGEDRSRAEHVARQLQAGAVFVNALVRSDVRLPFGGTRQSGYGRELAEHGIREFVNIRSVWVD